MKIKWLEVENYGAYLGGPHRLELFNEDSDKPLTVIQGLNGAGKTSLLKAILIAIHGERNSGQRMSLSQHHRILMDLVPRHDMSLTVSASVCLSYQPSEGVAEEFVAKRSWFVDENQKIVERFMVSLDGVPLDENTWHRWDRFSELQFPPNLAPLFIFDGEKSGELISQGDSHALSLAYSRIFGLDIPRKLISDLEKLSDKLFYELADENNKAAFKEIQKEVAQAQADYGSAKSDLSKIEFEHEELVKASERIQTKLGVDFKDCADARENFISDKALLEASIELNLSRMKDLWGRTLPLMFCEDLVKQSVASLRRDQGTKSAGESLEAFTQAAGKLTSSEKYSGNMQAGEFVKAIQSIMHEDLGSAMEIVHDCSDSELLHLFQKMEHEHDLDRLELKELRDSLISAQSNLSKATSRLENMGTEDQARAILKEASEVSAQLGERSTMMSLKSKECEKALYSLEKLEIEQDRLKEIEEQKQSQDDPYSKSIKAIKAAKDYLQYLQENKSSELERSVKDSFNNLSRKGEVVSEISLGEEDGSLKSLTSADGLKIAPQTLSEGEKQVFALSYLWGLLSCDGREFPVVIDTPFGRLDSVHRRLIVEKFLVKDLSQVVLLVTDSEADQKFEDAVRGHVSRRYHLDHQNGFSSIREIDVTSSFEQEACSV